MFVTSAAMFDYNFFSQKKFSWSMFSLEVCKDCLRVVLKNKLANASVGMNRQY